ncbi:FtsB family cell division protein [Helicovermis profundi]|uniref:Septum formation initiator n=1 Tax=Helicovermis profundi TaxID=3065157 RepID=A0AAU9EBH7_9FIRM|nr:hypothetical protein HLPR_02330 [Clostridia bacterium S502]
MNNRKKFIIRNKLIIIFFVLFTVYISYTLYNQNIKFDELKKEELFYDNNIKNSNKKIEEINEEIKQSESLDAIEKIAREKLNMVKPNEIIYIIQDSEKKEDNK